MNRTAAPGRAATGGTGVSTWTRFVGFLRDVRTEARKVTWPTMSELRESTVVVLVTVAIISAFIFVVDRVVGQIITTILR